MQKVQTINFSVIFRISQKIYIEWFENQLLNCQFFNKLYKINFKQRKKRNIKWKWMKTCEKNVRKASKEPSSHMYCMVSWIKGVKLKCLCTLYSIHLLKQCFWRNISFNKLFSVAFCYFIFALVFNVFFPVPIVQCAYMRTCTSSH